MTVLPHIDIKICTLFNFTFKLIIILPMKELVQSDNLKMQRTETDATDKHGVA